MKDKKQKPFVSIKDRMEIKEYLEMQPFITKKEQKLLKIWQKLVEDRNEGWLFEG